MTTALTVQPKKVRGLSLLQKRIMAVAAKGWITPADAVKCTDNEWDCEEPLGIFNARIAASASRALRRLVQRGLLVYTQPKYKQQSAAYRLPDFADDIPYKESRSMHGDLAVLDKMSFEWKPTNETLKQFDIAIAERHKRLDTSLTKAEREIGERLNTSLTEAQQAVRAEFVTSLAAPFRLDTPLTESRRVLSEDVSVDEGRAVLVGVLQRSQLGSQKLLVASRDSEAGAV